jgi:hypothetical protein
VSTNKSYKEGEILVYSIGRDTFRKFIEDPSLSVLDKDNIRISVYKKSINKEGYIERKIITKNPVQIDEAESGIMRIDWLPVCTEFIDQIYSTDKIENLLKQNELNCKVYSYVLINYSAPDVAEIPITIWAKTNIGNYFIAISWDIEDDPNGTEYIYTVYAQNEYYEKFKLKNGTLLFNGEDITGENYVKFENKVAYLPFEAIIEKLGTNIRWNNEKNIVWFTSGDKEYVYKLNDTFNVSKIEEGVEKPILKNEWFTMPYQIINNELILDNLVMSGFVSLFNATLNLDYENSAVEINTNQQM